VKRTPLRSRAHRVTVDERAEYDFVAQRDAGCVAPRLDPEAGACSGRLTRQHVKAGPGAPRVTHRSQLLMLCEHHHLWSGWATSKDALKLQRDHLRKLYPDVWGAR
jgi:hypothetical protein